MKGLQEKGTHLQFERLRQNFQLTHRQVAVIKLLLLLLLLFILDGELVDEDSDKISVNHGVHDVNAEHHGNLVLRSRVNFYQSE